jgi:hypothetical protein
MRIVALLILLYPISGIADAQTAEQCPPREGAGDVLNCYNGIAPPPALRKPRKSRPSAAPDNTATIKQPIADSKPPSKAATDGRAPFVDMLDVENKKLGAKLKTLCRGC